MSFSEEETGSESPTVITSEGFKYDANSQSGNVTSPRDCHVDASAPSNKFRNEETVGLEPTFVMVQDLSGCTDIGDEAKKFQPSLLRTASSLTGEQFVSELDLKPLHGFSAIYFIQTSVEVMPIFGELALLRKEISLSFNLDLLSCPGICTNTATMIRVTSAT